MAKNLEQADKIVNGNPRPPEDAWREAEDIRARSIDNGWLVVPTQWRGKAPWMRRWDTYSAKPGAKFEERYWKKDDVTGLQIFDWFANTGARCENVYAVDIDVDDPETGAAVRLIFEGIVGKTPLWRGRTGSARGVLLWRKVDTAAFKRAFPLEGGAAIEVYGKPGSQVVIHGEHATSTDALPIRYEWETEAPWTIAVEDIPVATQEALQEAVIATVGAFPPPQGAKAALDRAKSPREAMEGIRDGLNLHENIVSFAGHRARRGQPMDFCIDELSMLLNVMHDGSERWRERIADMPRCVADIYRKEAADPDSLAALYEEHALGMKPPRFRTVEEHAENMRRADARDARRTE